MRLSRIYQNTAFQAGSVLALDQRASHYLLHVLRVKVASPLVLFDGKGAVAYAKIDSYDRKVVSVHIDSCCAESVESPLNIHLYQGVCRGEKMDFVLQKSVELGVQTITPFVTERCQSRLDEKRQAKRLLHWQQVMISACEQSGRTYLPKLNPFLTVSDYSTSKLALVLHPEGSQSITSISNFTACDLLIGPEGGFTEDELTSLTKKNVKCVTMGPRILRAETAGLAAIAVLQSMAGDF